MSRSLTTLPNNTSTSQVAELYTASGFNAGDLVYYQGGDYKSAPNLSMSNNVVFSNTQNVNTSNSFGNAAISPVFPTTSGVEAGSTGGQFAAVLTDGNIVQAFVNTGPTPGAGVAQSVYFRVVDTSGVVQVSPTRVGTSVVANSFTVNVVALTGGGFAVVFINNGGVVSYAIYTNTGSLTTALTTDTGIGSSTAKRLEAIALANGGFAVATVNTTNGFVSTRAYDATGTAAYAWVSTGVAQASLTSPFGLSSRSDSSTIVAFTNSGTSLTQYFLYNSAGGAITNGSFTTQPGTAYTIDVTCLADGTTYVIGYITLVSSSNVPAYRLLPTGNTLGAEFTIPGANFNSGGSTPSISYSQIALLAQASGGFVLAFADNSNAINYAFFNTSGTILSGANPIVIPTARACRDFAITLLEISGFVNMYWTIGLSNQAQSNPNQSFVQINSTTYALVPQTSTVSGLLSTATLSAGAAVASAATPLNTRFFPATTTTNTSTQAIGAVVVAPTVITSTACNGISSCTLPNGQFVIAYKQSSPSSVFASVYSPSGALVTTITVAPGNTIGTVGAVKVAALSSGKFVVGWMSTTTTVSLNLYSSTFTQIGTTQTVTLQTTYAPNGVNFDVAGLGGSTDRYVVAFVGSSGFLFFTVFDNTNTVVTANTNASNSNGVNNIRLAADNIGGFSTLVSSGTSTFTSIFSQTGTSTYSVTSTSRINFSNLVANNSQLSNVYANNGYYQTIANTATNALGFHAPSNSTNTTNLAFGDLINNAGSVTTTNSQALGLNGNGHIIYVSYASTTQAYLYILFGGVGSATSGTALTTQPVNRSVVGGVTANTTTYGSYSICPSLGNKFVLAWLDASNFPNFAIYNSLALTTTFTTTAGVSQSNLASIQPTPSTATSVVPSTILTGVAITNAAANSTGQVAVNGLAQLSSSYPSGTNQVFDYTGHAINGVKGVINGRVVNIQGNT